jgi:hypothetical protein
MIADAVERIQAIEQQLTEKTQLHLQTRLAIRGCLKELRTITGYRPAAPNLNSEFRASN